jgi:hypothetical protein
LVRGLLSKHFRRKALDERSFAPGVGGESGFPAGLVQEGLAIPVMLDWDLGEQEAAITMHADQKAVASDFDEFRVDGLGRGKNAELNLQMGRFVEGYRVEAVIFEGGGASGIGDGAVDGTDGQDVSDAAAQAVVQVEGRERASGFGEVGTGRIERDFAGFEG